jgi:hypothetical protein
VPTPHRRLDAGRSARERPLEQRQGFLQPSLTEVGPAQAVDVAQVVGLLAHGGLDQEPTARQVDVAVDQQESEVVGGTRIGPPELARALVARDRIRGAHQIGASHDVRHRLHVHGEGREQCRGRRGDGFVATAHPTRQEQDEDRDQGVQGDVDQVVAQRIRAADCVVDDEAELHERPVAARADGRLPVVGGEDLGHASDRVDLRVLEHRRLVVEREAVSRAVRVEDQRQQRDCQRRGVPPHQAHRVVSKDARRLYRTRRVIEKTPRRSNDRPHARHGASHSPLGYIRRSPSA